MWSVAIKPILLLVMLMSVVDEGKDIKSVLLSLSLSLFSVSQTECLTLSASVLRSHLKIVTC